MFKRAKEIHSKVRGMFAGPRMHKVSSSAIAEVGYQRRRRSMIVRFRNGREYEYGCIDPAVFRQFLAAESKGRYFNREIIRNYPFIESRQRLSHQS